MSGTRGPPSGQSSPGHQGAVSASPPRRRSLVVGDDTVESAVLDGEGAHVHESERDGRPLGSRERDAPRGNVDAEDLKPAARQPCCDVSAGTAPGVTDAGTAAEPDREASRPPSRRAGDVVSSPRQRPLRPVVTRLEVAGHELRPVATWRRERIPAALGRLRVERHVARRPILARGLRPDDGSAAVPAGGLEALPDGLLGHEGRLQPRHDSDGEPSTPSVPPAAWRRLRPRPPT